MLLKLYKRMFIRKMKLYGPRYHRWGKRLQRLAAACQDVGVLMTAMAPMCEKAPEVIETWETWGDVVSGRLTPDYQTFADELAKDIGKELAKGEFFTVRPQSE